jgi:hypothetical protein
MPGIVRAGKSGDKMRFQAVTALALAALLAGCGGGWFGPKNKPAEPSDTADMITKPLGPGLVARCPVPAAYDEPTTRQIQQALDSLPKDSVLRKVLKDYETERDNLRMCQHRFGRLNAVPTCSFKGIERADWRAWRTGSQCLLWPV